MKETRNSKVLRSFVKYCEKHPDQRFYQALLNWSGLPWIVASSAPADRINAKLLKTLMRVEDTYYWEGKDK